MRRFWTMDTVEGDSQSPLSLHRYLYVSDNAVNQIDPMGTQGLGDMMAVSAIVGVLTTISALVYGQYIYRTFPRMLRGTIIHENIYPYYRAVGFICNQAIGTIGNPPPDYDAFFLPPPRLPPGSRTWIFIPGARRSCPSSTTVSPNVRPLSITRS